MHTFSKSKYMLPHDFPELYHERQSDITRVTFVSVVLCNGGYSYSKRQILENVNDICPFNYWS